MIVEPPLKWTDSDGDICVMMMASAGDTHLVGPDDIVAALLANPEARMAVLEKMPEVQRLEVAGRLVRAWVAGEDVGDLMHCWEACDHNTLSAPTAESEKDSVSWGAPLNPPSAYPKPAPVAEAPAQCEKEVHSNYGKLRCVLLKGHPGLHSHQPQCNCGQTEHTKFCHIVRWQADSPVAEAPERVTHEEVRKIAHHWAGKRTADILLRYADQREQSEREVAELRRKAEVSDMWKRCSDDTQKERDSYKRLLTDANLKAEGLRVDNAELRRELERRIADAMDTDAKLAESERKLASLRDIERTARAMVSPDSGPMLYQLADFREQLAKLDASPEPAGMEAGKADPTPTETEASASEPPFRFAIGDKVRHDLKGPESEALTVIERCGSGPCGDANRYRVRNRLLETCWFGEHQLTAVEPADPAPPKPGGEVVVWSQILRDVAVELSKPNGARHSVPGYALVDALRLFADRLEREGGGGQATSRCW